MSSRTTRPALVLIGPPGSGKTTVGRVLARRLGVSFTDVDMLIVERIGKPIAAMFTEDGVYDAPMVPDDHPLRHLVGRDAIRTGTSVYHQRPTYQGTPNLERSAYVLHDTTDPDVFMAEIDVAFDEADGRRTTMSLLQIFRLRDGQIARLRDYFAELPSVESDSQIR